jgi:hypothetical protein
MISILSKLLVSSSILTKTEAMTTKSIIKKVPERVLGSYESYRVSNQLNDLFYLWVYDITTVREE